MNREKPPINEIVGFLNQKFPDVLESIRDKYPEQKDILKLGIIAGEKVKEKDDIKVRLEVSVTGIKNATKHCKKLVDKVKKELKRSKNIQFVSQLITTISSASIFGSLALELPTVTYLVALLTLISSIFALFSKHLLESPLMKKSNLYDIFKSLVESQAEADLLLQDLSIYSKLQKYDTKVLDSISRTNALCARIRKLSNYI